jgi:AraC-like DNA-binding protein
VLPARSGERSLGDDISEGTEVIAHNAVEPPDDWTTLHSFEHLRAAFPFHESVGLVNDHTRFSLTQRVGQLGPLTVLDLAFGTDTWIRCLDERPYYTVSVPVAGLVELSHRQSSITVGPGRAAVCLPEGELLVPRWEGGGRTITLRIDRNVVEDALSDALGRQMTSQIAFRLSVATTQGTARSWVQMVLMLNRELFKADNALCQPLVAAPFVESLVHALLLATDHPYRECLEAEAKHAAPQTIRTAVDIIEAEPHLPLRVSSLAARSHVSARALQQGFQRHMGVSPMNYLRQVRLRRAHQDLLESDPSSETVESIASRWGFTNPGRFAAAHAARYGENPAQTLRRSRYPRAFAMGVVDLSKPIA